MKTTKKITHQMLIDAAKRVLDGRARVLAVRDTEWRQEWDAAPNPFAAVAQHQTPAKRAERKAVIGPWLAAQAALNKLQSRPAAAV